MSNAQQVVTDSIETWGEQYQDDGDGDLLATNILADLDGMGFAVIRLDAPLAERLIGMADALWADRDHYWDEETTAFHNDLQAAGKILRGLT